MHLYMSALHRNETFDLGAFTILCAASMYALVRCVQTNLVITDMFCLTSLLVSTVRRDGKTRIPSVVLALALLALFASTTLYFVYAILAMRSTIFNLLAYAVLTAWQSLPPEQAFEPPSTGLFKDYNPAQVCARTAALSVNVRRPCSFHPIQHCHALTCWVRRSYSAMRSSAGEPASFGRTVAPPKGSASRSFWRPSVSGHVVVQCPSAASRMVYLLDFVFFVGLGLVDIEHTCVPDSTVITNPSDASAGFLYARFSYGVAASALSFGTNFWATALVGYKALCVVPLAFSSKIFILTSAQGVEEIHQEARHRGLARAPDGARPRAPRRVRRVLLCGLGKCSVAPYASPVRSLIGCVQPVYVQAVVVVWQIGDYEAADVSAGADSFWGVYGVAIAGALVPVIVCCPMSSLPPCFPFRGSTADRLLRGSRRCIPPSSSSSSR